MPAVFEYKWQETSVDKLAVARAPENLLIAFECRSNITL
jgi:hypothetical protein